MTTHEENKLSMYLTVQQVTNFHSEVWKDSVAFANSFNEYETLLNTINKTRQIQLRSITGVTQMKWDAMFKASEKGFFIAQPVCAYAKSIGDHKTVDRVSFSISKLMNERDTVIFVKLRDVKEFAQNYLDQLGDYGITQADIDELDVLTEHYAVIVENPRQSITNRARATKDLREQMNEAKVLLTDYMDRLVYRFKAGNPEFWQQYMNARKIINLGHRRRVEKPDVSAIKAA